MKFSRKLSPRSPDILVTAISLAFLVTCLPTNSHSQQAPRGRLPDGSAYRIENGFRLVDRIAELEVESEELKSKISALESELNEKDRAIRNCSERRISTAETNGPISADCDRLISSLYLKISDLESRSNSGLSETAELPKSRTTPNETTSAASELAQDSIEKNETTVSKDATAKSAAVGSGLPSAAIPESRARLETRAAKAETPANSDAVSITSQHREMLANIEKRILERKNLYDSSSKASPIKIHLSSLVGSSGRSLDKVRIQLRSKQVSLEELKELTDDLKVIHQLLTDDINTLKRLKSRS